MYYRYILPLRRMRLSYLIQYVTLAVLVMSATGFVLSDSQCVVPNPCTCDDYSFVCDNATLTDVPAITITNPSDQDLFYISFQDNDLTMLSSNAFINIGLVHATSVEIHLDNNKIATVDQEAFTGVENTTLLSLGFNQLTSLPSALGKLDKLQELFLIQNPLSSLDPAIMAHLGKSLTHFLFDMQGFGAWPLDTSNTFQQLVSLTVENIRFRYLPHDAFDAFASSLRFLHLTNVTLAKIPVAVCHLHQLEQIRLSFNSVFSNNNTLSDPCSPQIKNLYWMILDGGYLRTFPRLLLDFPSVTTLQVRNHDIHLVHSDVIPDSSILYSLDLSNNSLPRIPYALNKLTNISQLNLIHNQITSVEELDLIGLIRLESLKLSENPIEYIAPNAFKNNTLIRFLYLDNTRLHLIPEVVCSLPRLYSVWFGGNNAECSCRLSFLRGLGINHVNGDCADRGESIQKYITTDLPSCP